MVERAPHCRLAGGWAVGAVGGAIAGSVVQVIGTAVGGFIGGAAGSIGGSSAAAWGSKKLLDKIRADDAMEVLGDMYAAFVNDCEHIVALRGRVSIDVEAPSEQFLMGTAGYP